MNNLYDMPLKSAISKPNKISRNTITPVKSKSKLTSKSAENPFKQKLTSADSDLKSLLVESGLVIHP